MTAFVPYFLRVNMISALKRYWLIEFIWETDRDLLSDMFVVSALWPTKSCVSWFQLHFKAVLMDHKEDQTHFTCLLQGVVIWRKRCAGRMSPVTSPEKPDWLSDPLRHRRRARWHPILCACVSVHVRDVSWVLWRYVFSSLSGVAVCLAVVVESRFSTSEMCACLTTLLGAEQLSGWTLDWLNGALILTQVEMRDLTETVKWLRWNLITLFIESTSSLAFTVCSVQSGSILFLYGVCVTQHILYMYIYEYKIYRESTYMYVGRAIWQISYHNVNNFISRIYIYTWSHRKKTSHALYFPHSIFCFSQKYVKIWK